MRRTRSEEKRYAMKRQRKITIENLLFFIASDVQDRFKHGAMQSVDAEPTAERDP
jgi:hypothetical protein